MYTNKNFKTKKELKQAVEAWQEAQQHRDEHGVMRTWLPDGSRAPRPVTYYQPGPFGGNEPRNGTIYCEGPHYPEPHRWYAQCEVKDGVIVKVK